MEKTTIRYPIDQARALAQVARVDGMSVAATIRAALDQHIRARRADPDFQARLRQVIEEDQVTLRTLEGA